MNAQALKRAVDLAEERQHMLISTANGSGRPHIASIGSIRSLSNERLALGDWHCPATVLNIQENAQVSMVVWDIVTDT
ncbi:MAG: pyridoxamine 5'-phosphate oxidase family protein, partial [Anaerolineae bacterium]